MEYGKSISRFFRLSLASTLLIACSSEKPPLQSWQHSQYGNYAAAFSPDKRFALVGDIDLPAKLWDIEAGKIRYSWQNQPGEAATATDVAFSPDGTVAATCESNTVVLWRMTDGKPISRLQFPVTVKDMALSANGSHILMALQDRTAVYFDVGANQVRQIFEHDGAPVNSPINQLINTVALSANGKLALTGGDDQTARLWDLQSGEQIRQWKHGNTVTLVSFSPQDDYVVTSAGNDQTRVWALPNGEEIAVLNTSPVPVDGPWGDFPVFKTTTTAIGFSSDNRFIVTGHPNQEICIWRARDGENISCWLAPRRDSLKPGVLLQALTFSPDGQSIYSETGNGLAQKWSFQHD
ncbi:WD40 repeat domain-containing protein [Methylophaga sp.]|uniref:WD40 repeat domain-containing protein n=1 Tax=Methylophaga sp. TaxID=2024840 RepID=UPI0013FFC94B|nr:WD40 repeat domain-containing protein [Methylophaga sp.]MTI64055.1 WD40 repeat domain-containing protein [Methylophaga sp.]